MAKVNYREPVQTVMVDKHEAKRFYYTTVEVARKRTKTTDNFFLVTVGDDPETPKI